MSKGFLKYQLAERVNEALDLIGFKKPTAVQEQVIPLILSRRNVVVEAATGTGKTAAYGLPLLSRIDMTKRSTQVLVLAPSRELALQVEAALRSFTTHEKFRVASVYGGMSLTESEKKIKSSPHILVAVPGRLKDVLRGGKVDHLWRDIKYLVIDEADKLLEAGFQETLDNIVSHVRNLVQVALFSATISEDVEALIRERFHPLQVVRLSPQEALRNIQFNYIVVDQGQKQRYLAALILHQKVKQALIFTPNRDEVYSLANFLRGMGHKAEAYHGLLDQVERAAVMKRFKKKQVNFLVATDLAARGLDVENLPAVINYAFPDELEIYLHRCGRTGRAGKRGAVYNLVASKKEEVLVDSFHAELQVPIKGYQIDPLTKDQVQHVEFKQIKVHLSKGKRDKIGAGDIVGFLVNATGVPMDRIGTIAVYDAYALADLPEWAYDVLVLNGDELKLKGKAVKVTKYSLDDQMRKAEANRKGQIGVRDKRELAERISREEKSKAGAKKVTGKLRDAEAKAQKDYVANKPMSEKSGAAGKRIKQKLNDENVPFGESNSKAKSAAKAAASAQGNPKATQSGARKGKSVAEAEGDVAENSYKPRGRYFDEKGETTTRKGVPEPVEKAPRVYKPREMYPPDPPRKGSHGKPERKPRTESKGEMGKFPEEKAPSTPRKGKSSTTERKRTDDRPKGKSATTERKKTDERPKGKFADAKAAAPAKGKPRSPGGKPQPAAGKGKSKPAGGKTVATRTAKPKAGAPKKTRK